MLITKLNKYWVCVNIRDKQTMEYAAVLQHIHWSLLRYHPVYKLPVNFGVYKKDMCVKDWKRIIRRVLEQKLGIISISLDVYRGIYEELCNPMHFLIAPLQLASSVEIVFSDLAGGPPATWLVSHNDMKCIFSFLANVDPIARSTHGGVSSRFSKIK